MEKVALVDLKHLEQPALSQCSNHWPVLLSNGMENAQESQAGAIGRKRALDTDSWIREKATCIFQKSFARIMETKEHHKRAEDIQEFFKKHCIRGKGSISTKERCLSVY